MTSAASYAGGVWFSGDHRGDGLRRVGGEVERGRRSAALHQLGAEGGDHRAVVGAQPRPRHPHPDAHWPRPARRPSPAAGSSRRRRRRSGCPRCRASGAASSALRVRTSQTASWKDAATSATAIGSPARCCASTQRATAVLSPENEKSKRCRSRSLRRGQPAREVDRDAVAARGGPVDVAGRRGTAARAAGRPCRRPRPPRRRWSRRAGRRRR